jgi:hypothetical protein
VPTALAAPSPPLPCRAPPAPLALWQCRGDNQRERESSYPPPCTIPPSYHPLLKNRRGKDTVDGSHSPSVTVSFAQNVKERLVCKTKSVTTDLFVNPTDKYTAQFDRRNLNAFTG